MCPVASRNEVAGGRMEMPITWGHVIRIWWAYTWRGLILSAVAVLAVNLLFGWPLVQLAMHFNISPASRILEAFQGITALAVSVLTFWWILGKQFGDFRLVLAASDECASDQCSDCSDSAARGAKSETEQSAIEIRDFVLASVVTSGDCIEVCLKPAYVHKSEGEPGVDSGTGWTQEVRIRIRKGRVLQSPSEVPLLLQDGCLVTGKTRQPNIITIPCGCSGSVELTLDGVNGQRLVVAGTGIDIVATSPRPQPGPRPSPLRPAAAKSAWSAPRT
jgi:hypothetical protein